MPDFKDFNSRTAGWGDNCSDALQDNCGPNDAFVETAGPGKTSQAKELWNRGWIVDKRRPKIDSSSGFCGAEKLQGGPAGGQSANNKRRRTCDWCIFDPATKIWWDRSSFQPIDKKWRSCCSACEVSTTRGPSPLCQVNKLVRLIKYRVPQQLCLAIIGRRSTTDYIC